MHTFNVKAPQKMNYSEIPVAIYVAVIVVLFKLFEWLINKLDQLWAGQSTERNKAQDDLIREIKDQNGQILKTITDMNNRLIANEKDYEHVVEKVRKHSDSIANLDKITSELRNELQLLGRIITDK